MINFIAQYWIEALFGLSLSGIGVVIKILSNKVRTWGSEMKAFNNGLLSLLRAEIIRSHEKYTDRKYCPVYAKEAAEKAYNAYHLLGGNGTITKLYDEIMALPTERKKENERDT